MVYFLQNEFMAPANQVMQEEASFYDEQTEGMMARLVLAKQATFDKPAKNRHMRPLYLRGYVNGKPLTKMFAKKCVDAKSALNAKHTASRTKLASHAQRAKDVPVNFS
jgi:hypothetical protein